MKSLLPSKAQRVIYKSHDPLLTLQLTLQGLYKSSLYATAKHLLGYTDVIWSTHGEMISCLERPSRNKMICVPRGCFKSSLTSVAYPIISLLRNPNERILIDSEVYTNSKNQIREISAHFHSKQFQDVFGNLIGPIWNEGEIILSTRTEIRKEASITAGGVGTIKVGQHYTIIIADDLCSTNNILQLEQAQKVTDHYRMYTGLLEPGGTLVIVGTRYAEHDIIGYILKEELGIASDDINRVLIDTNKSTKLSHEL